MCDLRFVTSVSLTFAGLLTCLSGCGYSHRQIFPQQYQTVAAPTFENRTFYRDAQFDLGEALVKEIERRTPYKVTDPASADTMLQGAITRVEQTQLARRRPGGVPQEMEARVVVDFEWKDLRTGQTIRERQGLASVGRYVPTTPLGEPFTMARHAAMGRLAQDIVTTLQGEW